jgi:alkylation response protein AidB-like acyl-CoA dehydrogenase
MDLFPSHTAEQTRDTIRKWAARGYSFETRQANIAAGGFSLSSYGELVDLGLSSMTLAERWGGMALEPSDALAAIEELGRQLILEPLADALMAGALLDFGGSEQVAQDVASALCGDGRIVAVALGGDILASNRYVVEAELNDGTWVLGGSINSVRAGDAADLIVVPGRVEGRLGLFVVERPSPGLKATGYVTPDGSRAATLSFDMTPATLLLGNAAPAIDCMLDWGAAATCAEAVGVMERALDLTIEYSRNREQFGVAIGSFQAIRHRLVDMKVQLELARSVSYYAAIKLRSDPSERRLAVSRAKYQIGTSARLVSQEAVQLHGGIGMTDEAPISHCFRRLALLELMFGSSNFHLERLSENLGDLVEIYDAEE